MRDDIYFQCSDLLALLYKLGLVSARNLRGVYDVLALK
jgi:hypothetical protein